MENADLQVLSQLTRWIEAGEKCWLCTVVKTWGSSPRPVGSLLCCNSAGQLSGSLSGGCIEDDLLEKLQRGDLAPDRPRLHVYGATDEDQVRFNLPCGGQLHIVIEPFQDQSSLAQWQHVVARLTSRQCIERKLDVATGDMHIEDRDSYRRLEFKGTFTNVDTNTNSNSNSNSNSNANANVDTNVDTNADADASGETLLTQSYGPRYQLFLIGASNVAMYLAELAQKLDYHVVVCDPREAMLNQWPIDGVQLIQDMPDDAVRKHVDHFSAVIALTHDPRIDDMGLMEALKTDAFFVGAMGSTRTSAKRRERLLMLDLSEAEIARLHAPVGLPIGSKTPAEIAIAILAQLIALRAEKKQDLVTADFRVAVA